MFCFLYASNCCPVCIKNIFDGLEKAHQHIHVVIQNHLKTMKTKENSMGKSSKDSKHPRKEGSFQSSLKPRYLLYQKMTQLAILIAAPAAPNYQRSRKFLDCLLTSGG